jgi:hypothetical protein
MTNIGGQGTPVIITAKLQIRCAHVDVDQLDDVAEERSTLLACFAIEPGGPDVIAQQLSP